MATGKNIFKGKQFTDEDVARGWFEFARWPDGPVCPHCGSLKHYATKKAGRYRCGEKECRKDYTVMTKSVMERSHAPLTQWAMAFHLYASSKKGFTAAQLHRHLGCEYNTAWFLHHRVMEAMRRGGLDLPPMGGPGKVVGVDGAYHGNVSEAKRRTKTAKGNPFTKGGTSGPSNKRAIIALVERGGSVRSFHVPTADAATVAKIVRDNVHKESRLHTDESKLYPVVGRQFAAHETINHSGREYARGCAATTSIARRKICTVIWLNLISDIALATSRIVNVRCLRFAVVKASASRIVNLTKPDFKHQAARFMRWRKKLPPRKVKRIWCR